MATNTPAPVWPSGMSSIKAANPFDPEKAADGLRKAMKGLGTNEDAIIKIFSSHCNAQRIEIDKKIALRQWDCQGYVFGSGYFSPLVPP
ncbi:Annexin A5 [Bulinus truncatus]|nr:Annexin A5 [Bulinus truncatus]